MNDAAVPALDRVRIVSFALVAVDDLLAHPLNPRRHTPAQASALDSALAAVGWIAPVLQSARSGRLIDGHLRVEAARAHGITDVPVCVVDLSEAEEALALAVYDPVTTLAQYDAVTADLLIHALPPTDPNLLAIFARLAPPPPLPPMRIVCPECGHELPDA